MTHDTKSRGICLIPMVIGTVVFFSMCLSARDQDELRGKMAMIDMELSRGRLSEEELEKQFLNLQVKYKSDEEKGQIYLHLADTLAIRVKQKNGDKIIKYSQFALRQPLKNLEMVRAYRILGDGLAQRYRGRKGKDWVDTRRIIVDPYLRGLKIVLDNLTVADRQSLPAVGRYFNEGTQEERQKMEEDYKREIGEREQIKLQNSLLEAKDAFIRDCADEYLHARDSDMPDKTELERLSKEILSAKYDAITWQIMDKITKTLSERKEREKKIRAATPGKDSKIVPGRRKLAIPKGEVSPR